MMRMMMMMMMMMVLIPPSTATLTFTWRNASHVSFISLVCCIATAMERSEPHLVNSVSQGTITLCARSKESIAVLQAPEEELPNQEQFDQLSASEPQRVEVDPHIDNLQNGSLCAKSFIMISSLEESVSR
eukprot:3945479-Amphidinium_carterae.1